MAIITIAPKSSIMAKAIKDFKETGTLLPNKEEFLVQKQCPLRRNCPTVHGKIITEVKEMKKLMRTIIPPSAAMIGNITCALVESSPSMTSASLLNKLKEENCHQSIVDP